MQDRTQGKYFYAIRESDDMTLNAVFTLFDSDTHVVTLQKGERVLIDEAIVTAGASAMIVHIRSGEGGDPVAVIGASANNSNAFPSAGNASIYLEREDGSGVGIPSCEASVASAGGAVAIYGRIIKS